MRATVSQAYCFRTVLLCVAGLLPQLVWAQTAPPPAADDQAVELPAYIVGTQGIGYVDGNTVSGYKTGQALTDIPQAELVMTQDLLHDAHAGMDRFYTDTLAYAGIATWMRNGTQGAMIRGARAVSNLTDDMIGPNWMSIDFVDSFEIIKGLTPYAGGALTGAIVATTKQPLDHRQDTATISVDSLGGNFAAIDSTGPLGKIGDMKVSYRLIGSERYGGYWFRDSYFFERDLHLMLKLDYHEAIVTLGMDWERSTMPYNVQGFLTPSGDLYTGDGYRNADHYNETTSHVQLYHRVFRANYIQKISDNWTSTLRNIAWWEQEMGDNLVTTGENWQTDRLSGIFRENNQPFYTFETTEDLLGKYPVGPMNSLTLFSIYYYETSQYSKFWTTTAPGISNTWSVPIDAHTGDYIDALHIPSYKNGEIFPNPANPGSLSTAWQLSGSIYQQLDIIPRWFSFVGGVAWNRSDSITDSNLAQYPVYTTVSHAPGNSYYAPRYGAIIHATRNISVFAQYLTQQGAPQSALDYFNNRLPAQQNVVKEVGLKTDLLNGRLIFNASLYRTNVTNVAFFTGLTNPQGVGYYNNAGAVTYQGYDGSLTFALTNGLQVLATWYKGTVKNQVGTWVSPGYGNSMSLFIRYQIPNDLPLKNLSFGSGFNRIGERYITTGGEVFPVGWTEPTFFKMHNGTQAEAFIDYRFGHHLDIYVNCTNLLDSQYPMGSQSAGIIDAAPPRSFALNLTYNY